MLTEKLDLSHYPTYRAWCERYGVVDTPGAWAALTGDRDKFVAEYEPRWYDETVFSSAGSIMRDRDRRYNANWYSG